MECPQCGTTNPDKAKFCVECAYKFSSSSSSAMSFTGQATLAPDAPRAGDDASGSEMSFTGQNTLDAIAGESAPIPGGSSTSMSDAAERYRIIDKIGEGGMGVVYRAEDIKLGRTVAVKRLRAGEQENRLGIERFVKEAQAIARLNHRNIVLVYDMRVKLARKSLFRKTLMRASGL